MEDNPLNLPDYAIVLLKFLSSIGSATQKELMGSLDLPVRKIRYGLRRLKEENLIIGRPDLYDMRSLKYEVNYSEDSIVKQYIKNDTSSAAV